ncbi:MAG TPA: serine hydrolase domain-containing protein, partial [Coxiellaceae bacterium]|nr:serine hydrolase domain-containing protein [Coxiellaceae bacterium]
DLTSAVVLIKNENAKANQFASGTILKDGDGAVTSAQLFGVGSITKTFVAATILKLQENKLLRLDDPIGLYLGDYPRWSKISLRQLLNMSSGIFNFTESEEFKFLQKNFPQKPIPPKDLIKIAYQKNEYFEPGKGWHYSNTNYYLLGVIIEKITHKTLSKVFSELFFVPLGLKHSFYSDTFYSQAILAQMAHAYVGAKDVTNFNASYYGAAGAMVMNSQDIMIWAHALLTPGVILTQENIAELQDTMLIPYNPPKPKNARFGLGIYALDIPGKGRIWYYAGVISGYSSVFVWEPSQKKMIIVQIASRPESKIDLLFPNQTLIRSLL